MPGVAQRTGAKLAVAAAAAALVVSPAFALGAQSAKHVPALALSFNPASSFTPANADPRLAAALAGKSLALADFKFTPAPAKGRPSQVRVAIRARAIAPVRNVDAVAPVVAAAALTATGYNLGLGIGWRRFALSGDVAKLKSPDPVIASRESAVLGVSYSLSNRLSARVAVGAERVQGSPIPALRHGDNMSLDLGSSYALSRRVALTGGVRYNIERDRYSALHDDRRDSQAVYVGTAFKF